MCLFEKIQKLMLHYPSRKSFACFSVWASAAWKRAVEAVRTLAKSAPVCIYVFLNERKISWLVTNYTLISMEADRSNFCVNSSVCLNKKKHLPIKWTCSCWSWYDKCIRCKSACRLTACFENFKRKIFA